MLLEVDAGHRLQPHTDSAEETIVVLAGLAQVTVDGRRPSSGRPVWRPSRPTWSTRCRNAGDELLRFLAIYASADVVTRYERSVEPDGASERRSLD